MWKLKHTKKDHWEHFIFVGNDCIVGRKDSTLLISNDPSVSRKHAVLSIKHPEENLANPSKKSSIFLRDEGSKYGTFKNGTRITNEEELSDNDIIKFGQFESEFRIHYEPLIVTTSCLDANAKSKLKKVIHRFGGHIVSEWQPSCTHLVMSQVKVTIKALCCLVSLKPIVLPEYFEELGKSLISSASTISPKEFIPPIGESLIDKDKVSFDVDPQRKNIFRNKTFFFMDEKQFKKLHLGIIMGGGNASIILENKIDIDLLLHENSCFIEPLKTQIVKEESKEFLKEIVSLLQKKNLRMIPESDIGLAVTYASTEKFCNPGFNVGSVVLGSQKIPSQTLTEREVYVPDTQERAERPKPSIRNSILSSSSEPKNKRQKLEAPDSLELTSFKEDNPEDIFEIPLSAQIKQELNDIFDGTMKTVNENIQKDEVLASTLPIETEVLVKIPEEFNCKEMVSHRSKLKTEENPVLINGNECKPIVASLESPKIERNRSMVNGNGFTSALKNDDEADLPRNLLKVKFASLIVKRPVPSADQQSNNSHVRNFKKFKKVLSAKAQALPRIIGGHDLIPYDRDAAKFAAENWDNEIEVTNKQPVKGAFDWDSQNG